MGQTKQAYLDWLCQQSKCHYCGDAAEDCECSKSILYTKGEWKIAGNKIDSLHIYREECPEPIIGHGTGIVVCEILSMSPFSMADAHLISSAPDMYEILKSIKEAWLLGNIIMSVEGLEMIDKVIAKAEGKDVH